MTAGLGDIKDLQYVKELFLTKKYSICVIHALALSTAFITL